MTWTIPCDNKFGYQKILLDEWRIDFLNLSFFIHFLRFFNILCWVKWVLSYRYLIVTLIIKIFLLIWIKSSVNNRTLKIYRQYLSKIATHCVQFAYWKWTFNIIQNPQCASQERKPVSCRILWDLSLLIRLCNWLYIQQLFLALKYHYHVYTYTIHANILIFRKHTSARNLHCF